MVRDGGLLQVARHASSGGGNKVVAVEVAPSEALWLEPCQGLRTLDQWRDGSLRSMAGGSIVQTAMHDCRYILYMVFDCIAISCNVVAS